MALHLYRGINRGEGTPKGSYRYPVNTFNGDIKYISGGIAVAQHYIEACNRVAGTTKGSYRSPG